MEITYDKLRANWDVNHVYVLHYINSQNDIYFNSERLWNAIMQQAIHIIRSSENEYWYLAANYDLLNEEMKSHVNNKTFISTPFITFKELQTIIRTPESVYMTSPPLIGAEVVMDMLLTNYTTQVTMLRKAERYV